MEKQSWMRLLFLVMGFVFLISGCSSLEKARTLHQKGQNEEALKMAQEFLDDDDEKVRMKAVNLIGRIGGRKAGEILMPMLDDPTPAVKNAAVKNMGLMKYAPASEKLIAMALEAKGDTFEESARAIRNIGPPAIDLLVKKFAASQAADYDRYKTVMLEVGPSVAAGIAKNLVGKSYFENRTNFELLIAFKNPKVASWMLKEIENEEVADMVVEGLTKLGGMAVLPVMNHLKTTMDESGKIDVTERLIRVLGDLKDQRAVSLLEKLTTDDSDRVRNAANFALKKIRGF
ncbi:MAG: HEAT repeat domain-containing protein [Proteobacteria bacterium]|nr:HEAT repeat domain-containing protein [Pseudomonadota bacterium]